MDRSNDCDTLRIGDFYFLYINAWPSGVQPNGEYTRGPGRHGEVAIFGFQDIPGDLDLYLTDRAWSDLNQSFVENTVEREGIIVFTTPADRGLPAGVAFGVGDNYLVSEYGKDWIDVEVNRTDTDTSQYFHLDDEGDQIFLYCFGGDGNERPIAAFSYNGPFLQNTTSSTTYGTNTSSAPDYFFDAPEINSTSVMQTPGLLVMREPGDYGSIFENWQFETPCGPNCVMEFNELRSAMSDSVNNWIGSNADGTFSFPPSSSSMLSPAWMSNIFGVLLLMWISVVV